MQLKLKRFIENEMEEWIKFFEKKSDYVSDFIDKEN